MVVDRTRIIINKCNKFLQTSWTAIFGVIAAIEAFVLMWWAEKLYMVWSRLYATVATFHWPWQVQVSQEEEVEAIPVAPKRIRVGRRQPAINARDACYKSIDA